MLIGFAYVALWAAVMMYFVYLRRGWEWAGQTATGLSLVLLGLLAAALVSRGMAAGRWPLVNHYEVSLLFTWMIVAAYLLLEASWRERRAGAFVLPIALAMATYAVTRPAADQAIAPLPPALRSPWFQVHVLSAMIGYGTCGVAAGLGVMWWVQRAPGDGDQESFADTVERMMVRAVVWGFPWLTLGILAGVIWAQDAWGRYWGWDPKETWALITWLWYLLILHAQALRGWRGRRMAGLAIVGLGIVLFTFVGVPWLVRVVRLESLHTP
ncbi:MAG: c-type cytochrome biogenesis protein CcsB [Chloroflexi bacterium]|nr:c-type cytochrome biogenesis protein CcsB [Chloroflexota bacterium]